MENNFLAVNKDYFKMGLKSVDIMIIAQVEEFQRNRCKCYITNKQLSEMFGESESTIKRSIEKLEAMDILRRDTTFIDGNGRGTKQRTLSVNNRAKWKVHSEPTKLMEGSNSTDGRFKNEEWKVHNEPIKDNLKDNLSVASATEKKKRTIEDLLEEMSCEQLKELRTLYDNHTSYKEIADKYNLYYFDASKFMELYESTYKEQYNKEHPEAVAYAHALSEAMQAERLKDIQEAEMLRNVCAGKWQKPKRIVFGDVFGEYELTDVETDNHSEGRVSSLEWLAQNASKNKYNEWEL